MRKKPIYMADQIEANARENEQMRGKEMNTQKAKKAYTHMTITTATTRKKLQTFLFLTTQLSLTFRIHFEILFAFRNAIFALYHSLSGYSACSPTKPLAIHTFSFTHSFTPLPLLLPFRFSFCTIYTLRLPCAFTSIWFVCLINVKHFQNNGYNEYKYNEWSRECGVSVLVTA